MSSRRTLPWAPGTGCARPLPVTCPGGHPIVGCQLVAGDALRLQLVDLPGRPYLGVRTDADGDDWQQRGDLFAEPDTFRLHCPMCSYDGRVRRSLLQEMYVKALNSGARRVTLPH